VAGIEQYDVEVAWTGDLGGGTASYRDYSRAHEISAVGRPVISGSSDPHFRGDREAWNPELLLVASLSSCHMLWYLHLCADAGVVVRDYRDHAEGRMQLESNGRGRFDSVLLRPEVTVEHAATIDAARHLHDLAHERCFIASSVNFPVAHEPIVRAAPRGGTNDGPAAGRGSSGDASSRGSG
jgi:organic hydroperoxide reductase OsmC/OhrA